MMTGTRTCARIPDIPLQRLGGGAINPASLAGQELVVLFCPVDPHAAAREIDSYRSLAAEFQDHGVWLLGILADAIEQPRHASGEAEISLAQDPSGAAWSKFESLLGAGETAERTAGAAFLFARWGSFTHSWRGAGHAKEVLEEARRRR